MFINIAFLWQSAFLNPLKTIFEIYTLLAKLWEKGRLFLKISIADRGVYDEKEKKM